MAKITSISVTEMDYSPLRDALNSFDEISKEVTTQFTVPSLLLATSSFRILQPN
jgi:hypothetical protein